MRPSSPLRLYAVIPRRAAPISRTRGIEREVLQQIRAGTVWLVVGRARKPLRPRRATLLAYDRVVRRIDELSPAILPARFGEVVENLERLKALVADRGTLLQKALDNVEHKAQMTLRLFPPPGSQTRLPFFDPTRGSRAWDPRLGARPRASARPHAGRAGAMRSRPGRTYLETRAATFRPPNLPEIEALHRSLGPLVRRETFRLGPAAGAVTLYHLIEKGEGAAYRAAVRKCADDVPGVRVQASGPFPPYAFTGEFW